MRVLSRLLLTAWTMYLRAVHWQERKHEKRVMLCTVLLVLVFPSCFTPSCYPMATEPLMRCLSIMHLHNMTFPVVFDVQLQSLPMSFVKHTQHAHKSDPWHQKTPKYNSSPAKHCLPCLASTEWSATAPSKSFCGSRSPFYWWPWRLHRSETAQSC